jgi:hypothetical protein
VEASERIREWQIVHSSSAVAGLLRAETVQVLHLQARAATSSSETKMDFLE